VAVGYASGLRDVARLTRATSLSPASDDGHNGARNMLSET
jgi:hypothetical protein